MRKLFLMTAITALVASPSAAWASLYVRGQLGYNWVPQEGSTQTVHSILGRVAAGLDGSLLGIEVGAALPRLIALNSNPLKTAVDTRSIYYFDSLVKLHLSLASFYVYTGAGAAYVHETLSQSSATTSYIRPKFVIGGGYRLTPHIALDLEYSWIPSRSAQSPSAYSPQIKAIAAGVNFIL